MNKNCFAYIESDDCSLTYNVNCLGCGFFKTKAQFDSDLEDSWKKIAKLNNIMQAAIAGKYYNNTKPWRKYISR